MRESLYKHVVVAAALAATVAATAHLRAQHTTVTFGTPSLWTLEQAHYLLAKQRLDNTSLKPKMPAAEALDPNAIHGSRLDILKTFFGAGITFDQAVGRKNQLALDEYNENRRQKADLLQQVDGLAGEALQLKRDAARVDEQVGALDPESNKAEITALNASAAAKRAQAQALTEEANRLKAKADTVTVAVPELATTTPTVSSPSVPTPVLDKVLSDPSFIREPKLHASTIIDNLIQLQYEAILKQVTLLRDDLADDQRLVFLELPQSIYTANRKSDDDLVQVWWRVAGAELCLENCDSESSTGLETMQRPPSELGIRGQQTCPGDMSPSQPKHSQWKTVTTMAPTDRQRLELLPLNRQHRA